MVARCAVAAAQLLERPRDRARDRPQHQAGRTSTTPIRAP